VTTELSLPSGVAPALIWKCTQGIRQHVTGDQLRHLRRTKLKLSQLGLAKRLGVTVTSVARWERNERVMSEIAHRFVRVLAEIQSRTAPALVARVERLLTAQTTRPASPTSRRRQAT
jgi:DNA-binding transcriptional regulator YiaG